MKSLLGVSKHAKNLVNRLYNLENVSVLLDNRKIRLISELVRKEKTRSYVLHVMTLSGKDRLFSIVEDIRNACVSNNVDFGMYIMDCKRKPIVSLIDNHEQNDELAILKDCVSNLHLFKNRQLLKDILESAIY